MIFGTMLRNRERKKEKMHFTVKNEMIFLFSADMILHL